jgi:hypothetical protein
VLHGVEVDGGVQGTWHGLQMGAAEQNERLILPAAVKCRIVDSLGEPIFHGIKQPIQFFEPLE